MFATRMQPQQQLIATQAGRAMLDTAVSTTQTILNRYAPISLNEMAEVALLNRTDTKFVMTTGTLLAALRQLHNDYRVLEVAGARLNHYQTLYFDTADFTLYHRHHAGASDRFTRITSAGKTKQFQTKAPVAAKINARKILWSLPLTYSSALLLT